MQSSLCNSFCALLWQSPWSCFYFEPQLIELLFAGFWLCCSMLPEEELGEQTAFLKLLLLPGADLEQLGRPTQAWAAVLRAGQGAKGKMGSLASAFCWRDEAGLACQGLKSRKILISISSVKREGGGLSSPQEKGCKLFLLLLLLKTISVQIFCDLFPWEFCIEIGNRNNERRKSDYVELVENYYCSCFSWSVRSQPLEEREEPLVAPHLPSGSECHSALSWVIFVPSGNSGAPVSLSAPQRHVHLSQARLGALLATAWIQSSMCFTGSTIFVLLESQVCRHVTEVKHRVKHSVCYEWAVALPCYGFPSQCLSEYFLSSSTDP